MQKRFDVIKIMVTRSELDMVTDGVSSWCEIPILSVQWIEPSCGCVAKESSKKGINLERPFNYFKSPFQFTGNTVPRLSNGVQSLY